MAAVVLAEVLAEANVVMLAVAMPVGLGFDGSGGGGVGGTLPGGLHRNKWVVFASSIVEV